jgi:hypothetical protein
VLSKLPLTIKDAACVPAETASSKAAEEAILEKDFMFIAMLLRKNVCELAGLTICRSGTPTSKQGSCHQPYAFVSH